ncbi:microtubule-associated protein 9 [Pholidichthys leucotaenia]
MTDEEFRTLAYSKSPKTSKRTTFQDELRDAVSARANKAKTESYSDDFEEDDDDFLNELIKLRKKKTDAFKSGKSKGKVNTFELSDEEIKPSRTKKVSFLKTQRISSSSSSTIASELHENDPLDSSHGKHNSIESFSSKHSTNDSKDDRQFLNSGVESTNSEITRKSAGKFLSHQTSDETLLDMSLPRLLSDGNGDDIPGPEGKSTSHVEQNAETLQSPESQNHAASTDSLTEREPPRPKPRQRTLRLNYHITEKQGEETESQNLSRPQTSSTSIPLSTDMSSTITWTEGDHTPSYRLSQSSSQKSDQSQQFTKSTVDSGSRDGFISDDSKEQDKNYTPSLEDFNEASVGEHSNQLSHVPEKKDDSRPSSSVSKPPQRPQSVCSRMVESKYLGTLKVLDRKVSLQESQPQGPDSLRAAVYQEWLKKKKEESRKNMQQKKKEELVKEQKKKEEEAKKEDAVASYEAWKEKKAEILKVKVKAKQEIIRKDQRATEEKEEKRQTAKQVFEKWKREHDHLLKEKLRKEKEAENKVKLEKQQKEDDRKKESTSAFSNWCEKKKERLHENLVEQRKEIKNKAEEEHYLKEEKDKMALEMYENWLARKELEHKRRREERRIQAILSDSPPPPWSPPNKTIPFRR